uniref:Uncharacterized protein n=1 Tax=Coccidioides posadasii RMSCC 3488 TaxID=454284 RepID=A0A0J6FB78_COCPO|nr:hypothetical protein CPAG_02524 [Coccidioides posadasii RMSCC 3488]
MELLVQIEFSLIRALWPVDAASIAHKTPPRKQGTFPQSLNARSKELDIKPTKEYVYPRSLQKKMFIDLHTSGLPSILDITMQLCSYTQFKCNVPVVFQDSSQSRLFKVSVTLRKWSLRGRAQAA